MTQPGALSNNVPAGADYLVRRLADIERELVALRTGRSLEAATIGSGGVTIKDDGSLVVKATDGHTVATFGALPPQYNRADGTPQSGVALYREDGSLAALLGDLNPTVAPFQQAWQVLDRSGNVIFADDTNSGKGSALPWLDLPVPVPTDWTLWPSTTSSAWTELSSGEFRRQMPGIGWRIIIWVDAATTGQVRVKLDGNVIATTNPLTNVNLTWTSAWNFPSGWVYGSSALLQIEAIRTSGTGPVRAIVQRLGGQQT